MKENRAFSLLEVLVTVAILGVLLVLLNQIVEPTMQVVGQGRRLFELHSKARGALDLISRDVNQGVFRSDLPAFRDDQGNAVLAFFTRRGGAIGSNDTPDAFRQLLFVTYSARDNIDTGSHFSLWRGALNIQWDGNQTYPAVSGLPGPLPFDDQTISTAYPAATDASAGICEPILEGVARMEVRFLDTDGKYRSTYNDDPAVGPLTKAATITLLVIDERTQTLIASSPGSLTAFRQNFISPASNLIAPEESETSLGVIWEQALAQPSTWTGIPVKARDSIHAFERTIPLR